MSSYKAAGASLRQSGVGTHRASKVMSARKHEANEPIDLITDNIPERQDEDDLCSDKEDAFEDPSS